MLMIYIKTNNSEGFEATSGPENPYFWYKSGGKNYYFYKYSLNKMSEKSQITYNGY